jgi:hypothetical protein
MKTYKTKAMVVNVTRPAVAHNELQWAVQVTWIQTVRGYAKKNKRWVFSDTCPKIGDWIIITLL